MESSLHDFRPVPRPWLRGPASIDGGNVVLDLAHAEQSWPWSNDDQLALDLANITTGEIPEFVACYGLLRSGPGSERLSEPVQLWLDTAHELRAYLTMAANLERARDIDREDWVEATNWLREAAGRLLGEAVQDNDEAQRIVTSAISQKVSEHLAGVELSLGALHEYEDAEADPGDFALVALPEDLIGFAYWRVAAMLASKVELRYCGGCHRVFAPRDARQRFHDAACANRHRQRRYLARQRNAG
jgi:hypothetical protein